MENVSNWNTLFNHQKMAIDRFKDESAIALFFDPGTGKTLTSLSIAEYKFKTGQIDALLVVAPNKVHKQWATEEVPKWLSQVPTTIQWRKNKKLFFIENRLNIVCTNIDQFSTKTRYMEYVEWANAHKTMIIVDEATRIKNPKAVRTQRLLYEFNDVVYRGRAILKSEPKTVARIILTGTPVTNGPFDVWSMFEFLEPGYFGLNYYAFQNKYGLFHSLDVNGRKIRILINEESWAAIHNCESYELAAAVHGVTYATYELIRQQPTYEGPFRNVDEIRTRMLDRAMWVDIRQCVDMPKQVYNRKLLDMSPEQARVYREMENMLIATYKDKEITASSKIVAYIRLQQIASGFIVSQNVPDTEEALEDPPEKEITWFDEKPKVDQLLNDVEEIVSAEGANKNQVIVVTHFSAEASMLFDILKEKGYKCCLMTGWKTVGSVEGFKQHKYDIMVANIRVIKEGLNLQEYCHHTIYYSNTFSLDDRLQSEARTFRIGQTETCVYIDYVMKDTIDMKVYAALKQKKSISDYIKNTSLQEFLTVPDETFKQEYKIAQVDDDVVIF